MKIALCNEVVGGLDFAAQCALARGLGYDGLEIAPFTLAEEPHRLPQNRRAELRKIAEDAGVAITGLHWLLVTPADLSITSPSYAARMRTVEVMRELIELCADLGGTVLVHGSPRQRTIHDGQSPDDALAYARECFAAIAPNAAQAGVTYCIEPLARSETTLINTVEEAAAIVDDIGSPALRTMIDCCAAAQTEDLSLPELIARWLPTGRVRHIHFNDPNRRAPGQGDLRFGPILAALARHDYAGLTSVEPFVYEPDGPTSAARAIGYLQGVAEPSAA